MRLKRDTRVAVYRGAYTHQVEGEPDLWLTSLCGMHIRVDAPIDRAEPTEVDCPACNQVRRET